MGITNRLLAGIVAGLGTGAAYGLARPAVGGMPVVVRGTLAGPAATVGTTGPMAALGMTDPREWSAGSWVSDLAPHPAHGLVTAVVWEMVGTRR
ncbi:hypothetical protein [Pseudonocardia sp.]|uniref:hypothetical protein n=1 Tax=Pseudonocardia sp. TaxID=60912 RepID=UPI003D0B024B